MPPTPEELYQAMLSAQAELEAHHQRRAGIAVGHQIVEWENRRAELARAHEAARRAYAATFEERGS